MARTVDCVRPVTRPAVSSAPLLVALALAVAGPGCAAEVLPADAEPADEVGVATEALRVCADGETVRGIDVSHWQGSIDWDAVAADGVRFAVIRVSDGTGTMDREFHRNWREARRVGIVRSVYQYFRPNQDPIAQAELLLSEVGALEPGDLPPVIDAEENGGRSPAQVASAIGAWLHHIENATGRKPMIYTARYFWQDDVGNADDFRDYPLWIANWGVMCPDLPSAFGDWTFWQTSATGRVDGIDGDVDMDVFNGSMDALRAFAGTDATCTPRCDGDDLVGPDCGRTSCAASGAECIDDAAGARCARNDCPATGVADLCVSDTLIAHCEGGAVTTTADCDGYAGLCSVAGRDPTLARCVSAFCVSTPDEVPVAHDGCWPESGKLMHCDANGLPTLEDCPTGLACSVAGGVAHCAEAVCPPSDAAEVCIDGRYLGACAGGSVAASIDCGEGACSDDGGAHCLFDECMGGRCGEVSGGCSVGGAARGSPPGDLGGGALALLGLVVVIATRAGARRRRGS